MEFKPIIIGAGMELAIIRAHQKSDGIILVDDINKQTSAFDNNKTMFITNERNFLQELPKIDEKEIAKCKKERETFARLKRKRKNKRKK